MKYLGIDYGTKRIGLANSDDTGKVAFPLITILAGPHAVAEVAAIIAKENIEKIVLGESRNLQGQHNPVMDEIREFKKELEDLCGLPVVFENELFSSAAAARQFTPDGSRKKNPAHDNLDAAAATLILQSYLDTLQGNG